MDVIACEVCRSPDNEASMLLCDSCETGWHIGCLDPPLEGPPDGEWYCPSCSAGGISAAQQQQQQQKGTLLAMQHGQEGDGASAESAATVAARAATCKRTMDSRKRPREEGKPVLRTLRLLIVQSYTHYSPPNSIIYHFRTARRGGSNRNYLAACYRPGATPDDAGIHSW